KATRRSGGFPKGGERGGGGNRFSEWGIKFDEGGGWVKVISTTDWGQKEKGRRRSHSLSLNWLSIKRKTAAARLPHMRQRRKECGAQRWQVLKRSNTAIAAHRKCFA